MGGLIGDILDQIAAKADILLGKIQEKYCIAQDETEMQVKNRDKTIG
jgi:uncharacterized protein YjbJ (UPF0337 family)